MSLIKYTNNFWPLAMDDFFSLDTRDEERKFLPSTNVWEDDKSYHLEVELPGLDKKNIKTIVKEDILTISAERKNQVEQKQGGYYHFESSYGKYERSFRLSDAVNAKNIKAKYNDGILHVELPKNSEVIEKEKEREKVQNIDIA